MKCGIKQTYGVSGKSDSNQAALVHQARRNGAVFGSDRRRVHGGNVCKAKAAIRRLAEPRAHVAELMREYGLTEGKVLTLIAKVTKEGDLTHAKANAQNSPIPVRKQS